MWVFAFNTCHRNMYIYIYMCVCVCVCVLHYFRLRRGPKAHAIMRTIRAEFSRNTNVKVRMALNTTNFVQDEHN